jgi:hypothetical protein
MGEAGRGGRLEVAEIETVFAMATMDCSVLVHAKCSRHQFLSLSLLFILPFPSSPMDGGEDVTGGI